MAPLTSRCFITAVPISPARHSHTCTPAPLPPVIHRAPAGGREGRGDLPALVDEELAHLPVHDEP
eukprot:2888355-Rhodomonas_salina.3